MRRLLLLLQKRRHFLTESAQRDAKEHSCVAVIKEGRLRQLREAARAA